MSRLASLFLLVSLCAPAAEKRLITAEDLYSFTWVADPQISPDGSQVAFTQVRVNARKDGYDTSLFLVSTAGGTPRLLTKGPQDSTPRWSPDGKRIAFLRASAGTPPQPAQIFILPMDGGEAAQLTSLAKGAAAPAWSPDGKLIAFTSTTLPDDPGKPDAAKKDDEKSDVRIINRAVYRFNGAGYTDFDRPAHIWTVPVPAPRGAPQKATQLTTGRV
ncbi:MAG: PD40 domain-containing protein, partial [Acidobacteria bacterium]|nr:PD40 domain-containing protein [Acidobacteriota bacterium]